MSLLNIDIKLFDFMDVSINIFILIHNYWETILYFKLK